MNRVAIICCLTGTLFLTAAKNTALISFAPDNIDSATTHTINVLFRESLEEFGFTDIITVSPDSTCHEKSCLLKKAQATGAENIILPSAHRLGRKWIVRTKMYKTGKDKPVASNSLDCMTIEDFEPVLRRHAEALADGKNIEQVAAIDNITEKESDPDRFTRREGLRSFGVQFGYLYPYKSTSYTHWDGSYGYNLSDASQKQFRQILSTDILTWFELPHNLALQWDFHVGWGAEMGTHLFLLRQFGRKDISPYAGGGVGIDYCFDGDPPENTDDDKRNSGFALIGKAGVQMLRTYNFKVHVDGGYKVVFNDDYDQGPYANIGVMWHKSRKEAAYASNRQNPLLLILAGIGGLVLTLTTIGIVSSGM